MHDKGFWKLKKIIPVFGQKTKKNQFYYFLTVFNDLGPK